MSKRVFMIMSVVAVAGVLFASGNSDSLRGNRGDQMRSDLLDSAQSYKGRFTMVEGRYPALVDASGKTWFLEPTFPIAGSDLPAEGVSLEVKAVRSPMSPVHLEIIEASVDGKAIDPDWSTNMWVYIDRDDRYERDYRYGGDDRYEREEWDDRYERDDRYGGDDRYEREEWDDRYERDHRYGGDDRYEREEWDDRYERDHRYGGDDRYEREEWDDRYERDHR